MFKKTILFSFMAIAILFTSCQKEETLTSLDNDEAIDVTYEKYMQTQLEDLQTALVGVSDNALINEIIRSEVSKQFDGEDNVLVKTIIEKASEKGVNAVEIMQTHVDSKGKNIDVEKLLNSFVYEGIQCYPQIYIPNFNTTKSLNSSPVLISDKIGLEDEEIEEYAFEGMSFDKLKSVNELKVTKSSSQNQLVYVVSINERVDENGVTIPELANKAQKAANVYPAYLGWYNVINLGALEGWTRGGPEFWVYNHDKFKGQLSRFYTHSSRSACTGSNWVTVQSYLFTWNRTSLGDYAYTYWVEIDGGTTKLFTISAKLSDAISISIPINVGSKDDHGGGASMYFPEFWLRTYNTGLIQWRMKNY